MIWQFIDSGFNPGKTNMDVDLQLANSCNPGEMVLRFYRWNPYCISLGANQKIEDIDLAKADQDNIDVVYRPTGGRAILHAEELTYSVIYPITENISSRNIYHEINLALIKGLSIYNSNLSALELETQQPNFPSVYKEQFSTLCFAVPAKSEIKYYGKKVVGSAQKKLKSSILQHGSILCGNYHLKIIDYLKLTPEDAASMRVELENKTSELQSILHKEIDYSRLIECLTQGFINHFNTEPRKSFLQESLS
jgi:lipoate-protein ligase A